MVLKVSTIFIIILGLVVGIVYYTIIDQKNKRLDKKKKEEELKNKESDL